MMTHKEVSSRKSCVGGSYGIRRAMILVLAGLSCGCILSAMADVWEDCVWRLGEVTDANDSGRFDNGDLTEYFHSADASRTTGIHKITPSAVSTEADFTNDTVVANTEVMRVTEGVSANQNVIRFRRPVVGDYIYCGKVSTSCQLTGNKYTVICRFRPQAFHPSGDTNPSWVFSSGWCWSDWRHTDRPQGGNGIMFGINGKGQVVVMNGQASKTFTATSWNWMPESWYRPLELDRWVDAAIIADGTKIRVYCSPENNSCHWWEYEATLSDTASLAPAEGFMVDMGSESGGSKKNWKTEASAGATKGFCGDIAELAAWNRALSKSEVIEALGKCGPALFRVGTKGRTKDFCGGAATAGTTTIATATRDPGAVSRTLNAGGRLEIPFSVPLRNDQLPQLFRIIPAGDSAAGLVSVAIDGNLIASDVLVEAGKMSKVFVKGQFLTTGDHAAVVTCLSGPVSWDVVDLCGSFCYDFGVANRYPAQYGKPSTRWGDEMAVAIADAYAGDWGRYDMAFLPCASGYSNTTLVPKRLFRFHWTPGDLLGERFTFKVQYGTYNGRGDEVLWKLLWNDAVVSPAATRPGTSFSMDVEDTALIDGDNVFGMDTDMVINNSPNDGVYVNSVTITVKKPRSGLVLLFR